MVRERERERGQRNLCYQDELMMEEKIKHEIQFGEVFIYYDVSLSMSFIQ